MIVAALDEAVGSFREEDGAEDEDGNGDCAHGERESRQPQPGLIFWVPKLRRFAKSFPMLMLRVKPLLIAPL